MFASLWMVSLWLLHIVFMARAVLRRHRDPASRFAWVVVMAVVPLLGIVAYLLLGETNVGRRRIAAMRKVLAQLSAASHRPDALTTRFPAEIPPSYHHLFQVGRSINGFAPVGGNRAQLLPDSNSTIDALVDDIDAATEHVHLLFYIWLPDHNGLKVVEALKRAARRQVACRAMADGLGSRAMIASKHWRSLREAGVQVATALPIGNPLRRLLGGLSRCPRRLPAVVPHPDPPPAQR